jgi:L-aspartate oxidase
MGNVTPMPELLDLLVLGSGVAGLSAAVRAAEGAGLRVGVLTKADLEQATTRWAQGGVAAVLGGDDPDTPDLHLADTLAAGDGLCDAEAVRVLVEEGPDRVHELIALGASFDRDPSVRLELAREGGHSRARVVHAGGAATGAEVERALVAAVRQTAAAVYERWFALDLLVAGGRCVGVRALDPEGAPVELRARHVLLATGGAGQLFAVTTNPHEATGDGVAMALRAGAAVADVEFVQFHPTALHHPAMPRPLLSEALRGHGALLRDTLGRRFVDELLPRDRVSRAITATLLDQGAEHVWLDATGLDAFAQRFPTINAALAAIGLDPATDWLPVSPAAHYLCGGVVTDLDGASSLPGLWAAGEVACNGVMGANRLASNSLLDGMVFGPRVVEAITAGRDGPRATGAMGAVLDGLDGDGPIGGRLLPLPKPPAVPDSPAAAGAPAPNIAEERRRFQQVMARAAGVLRSAESLEEADAGAQAASTSARWVARPGGSPGVAEAELENLALLARVLAAAAAERTETRGAHARVEFPDPSERLRHRLVFLAR